MVVIRPQVQAGFRRRRAYWPMRDRRVMLAAVELMSAGSRSRGAADQLPEDLYQPEHVGVGQQQRPTR
jgi:hypothetical protein